MMKKKFYIAAPVLAASTQKSGTLSPEEKEVAKANQAKIDAEKTTSTTKKPTVDEKYKEILAKWQEEQKKQGKNTNAGEGTRERLKKEAEAAVKESLMLEELTPDDTAHARYGGEPNQQVGGMKQNTDGTVQWDFKNSKNINAVVKSLYSYFKSDADAINELDALLKMTPEQRSESGKKVKTPIEKIYGLVRKKFNVKGPSDVVYKENLDSFLTKPEAIAEKINNLYTVTVKNDVMKAVNDEIAKNFKNNENLVLWEKMKQELVNFNSTMRGVLEPDLQFGKSSAESVEKKESLMKYSQFMKVFEADEETKPEAPEATKPEEDAKTEETPTEDSQVDQDSDDKGKPKELMNKNIINKMLTHKQFSILIETRVLCL
jgi:hypothetical protein